MRRVDYSPKIITIESFHKAHKAQGLTVVIDVLRAFTTACFIFQNGAEKIIPVSELDATYRLKKENPEYILMGERNGVRQKGFDFGNSPAEIQHVNMRGKTVILTTSAGTQGIVKASQAETVITGAFVNAGAVAAFIEEKRPKVLSLVITDDKIQDSEDFMFARYIASLLEKKPLDFNKIKKDLIKNPSGERYLKNPLSTFSIPDFHLAMELDMFDFVIAAEKAEKALYLKKVH